MKIELEVKDEAEIVFLYASLSLGYCTAAKDIKDISVCIRALSALKYKCVPDSIIKLAGQLENLCKDYLDKEYEKESKME